MTVKSCLSTCATLATKVLNNEVEYIDFSYLGTFFLQTYVWHQIVYDKAVHSLTWATLIGTKGLTKEVKYIEFSYLGTFFLQTHFGIEFVYDKAICSPVLPWLRKCYPVTSNIFDIFTWGTIFVQKYLWHKVYL